MAFTKLEDGYMNMYLNTIYQTDDSQPQDTMLASAPTAEPTGQVTVSGFKPQPVRTDVQPELGVARPIPQNKAQEALGYIGELLTKAGVQLDKVGLDIPVLGRISLKDLTVGESGKVLEDMALGFYPVEGAGGFISGTTRIKLDPALELLNIAPIAGAAAKAGGKAVVKGATKAVQATKGMPIGMSIKMVDGTDAVVPKAPAINTPEFINWFSDSKVVDDAGLPIAVYHGTGRPDRVGEQFKKNRATSGPMSFFTDNPEVASGYAKGKTDTSIAYDDDAFDYKNWFKKKVGRSELNLEQAGAVMSQQERNSIIEKLKDITQDENTGEIIYKQGGGSIVSPDTFDFYLKRESNNNPLVAANKLWLESGTLYGKEEEFAKVLKLSGVKGFEYNDPHARFPFVYKVFLSIKNPLDTNNIGEDIIRSLDEASKRVRKPTQKGGADNWDKNTVAPKDWIERLKSDQSEGTTHAWTSIPDWVTKTLKAKGFDGIKDSGGKGGGTAHNVWIPFEENQVKSAIGNKGTFSESKNIMRGVGVGGAGAAMQQEDNK